MNYYHIDIKKQQYIQRAEWITMAGITAGIFIGFFIINAMIDMNFWFLATLAPIFLESQTNAPFAGREKEYRTTALFRAYEDKITGPGVDVFYYRIKAVRAESRPARLGLLSFLLKAWFPEHLLIILTRDDDTEAELDVTLLADASQQALYQQLLQECHQNIQDAS